MNHKEIYNLLKTLDVPVAYDHFELKQNIIPPFIVYREISGNVFNADSITYFKTLNFEIELVTTKKDIKLQQDIEKKLTDNNIPYEVADEVWDSQEKIYHNFYEI